MTHLPPRRYRALIADIVMSCSELDHLISMALFKQMKTDYFEGFVITDKMSVSTKFAKLEYLVEAHGTPHLAEKIDVISPILRDLLKCRNTLVHGVFLEFNGSECLFVATSDYVSEENAAKFAHRVSRYSTDDLRNFAATGCSLCDTLRKDFEVRKIQETLSSELLEGKPPTPRSLRKKRGFKS